MKNPYRYFTYLVRERQYTPNAAISRIMRANAAPDDLEQFEMICWTIYQMMIEEDDRAENARKRAIKCFWQNTLLFSVTIIFAVIIGHFVVC